VRKATGRCDTVSFSGAQRKCYCMLAAPAALLDEEEEGKGGHCDDGGSLKKEVDLIQAS
jgi:hypothetical protein